MQAPSQAGSQPAPGSGWHSGAAARISRRGLGGKGCRLCRVRLPTCHALLKARAEPRPHSPWRDPGKRVRWASREESTARGLSHEPLLTPRNLAPPPRPGRAASAGSAEPPSPSSMLPASCPHSGRASKPRGPNTRLEDGSPCWPPCPLGAGWGLAPAAPASGPGPACLRACLLPSALHSWPHLQPQIPAALEAGCSPKGTQLRNSPSHPACRGLSPQPSGLTQVASAPRGGGNSAQGGSWTAHPTRGRPRAALFGCQTRGNEVPAHQAPEGRWPLVLGETQTLFRWWGVFWVSGTLLLQVFEPRA